MIKLLPLLILLAGCSSFYQEEYTTVAPVEQEEFSVNDFGFDKSGDYWNKPWGDTKPLFTKEEIAPTLGNVENDTARNLSSAQRFIVVNIPAQTLRVFENGEEILRSKVILGKTATPTPTQRSSITSVKLNPNWTAPAGGNIERTYTRMIQNGEADKLREINIEWRRRPNGTYQFFQSPGPFNVLGQVKFEMYSPSNTYLHDTNRPDLFNLAERFLSFGCIRVEKWDELTAWMLGWTADELTQYLENNTATEHRNIDNVEIHIVYWINETLDGQLVQWPNYYNR